ncbi:c-type cytochrome [Acidovorax radicis]|jgi:mono/diheme cytochrome c family protein|uniref:c-type cytochrome n=1 Tax=Acidovorax radicis TaxID=758826 RepID=UPI001CFB8805|nr:c-type cytochrome [Acidovorax radicis]UCV00917.1 c-type cytochrome [Acidovorax radicis]
MKRILWTISSALAALGITAAALVTLNLRGEEPLPASKTLQTTPELVARGEYLARVGNCMACHTTQGGAPFAGGRGIETPFGVVHSANLTPDKSHGIGAWTSAEFWRAMHHGRSKDGRLLYPAFPYPNYTQVSREDSDALFAYLQSVPAAADANRAHALRFPYNTQAALGVWRALFFAPATPKPDPTQTAEYNWGAYLVNGLGHCTACHTPRNALGATTDAKAFTGGLIPVQNWYAPALNAAKEAGVKEWRTEDVVALLTTGVAPHGSVLGPMAEVVFRSTQYLTDADARAMAIYLQALPQQPGAAAPATQPAPLASAMARGGKVYEQQCAQCHGDKGLGEAGAFPALAGNRAVVLADPTNLLRVVLQGGYLPATAGNPRPHGMPPFQQLLTDEEVAAVATFVRNSWGNQAAGVGTIEAYRARERRGL